GGAATVPAADAGLSAATQDARRWRRQRSSTLGRSRRGASPFRGTLRQIAGARRIRVREPDPRHGRLLVVLGRTQIVIDRGLEEVRAELAQIAFAYHELFVRRDAARAAGHSAQDPDAERNLQDSRDVRRDVVLDLEDVVARTLVRVSPNSAPGAHVDELRADSLTIAGRLQAA